MLNLFSFKSFYQLGNEHIKIVEIVKMVCYLQCSTKKFRSQVWSLGLFLGSQNKILQS